MIGRIDSARSSGFIGNRVRSATSAKARPSSVVSTPDQCRLGDGVPRHAAAARAEDAVEAPDRLAEQLCHEQRRREAAVVVAHRRGKDAQHRIEHEQRDQPDDEQDRADDEHVALARAKPRQAVGEQHQAGERVAHRAPAQRRLARAGTEQSR